MAPAVRFLLITTVQIVVVVVAFAFVMTLLFDRAGWWEFGWLVDLLPLLTTIVVINCVVQLARLRRQAARTRL
ncbi:MULTISPECIES: hypothetical protein [unclassified Micromonospora]|uniref:hypothetical protein n=1 Tax=unclassified Micromonospora TaxID=2617518 RepID=UPI003A871382